MTEEGDAVLADPQAHLGEEVSVEAQVDEVLDDGLFTVTTPDAATGSLLVMSGDGAAAQAGSEVMIEGSTGEGFDVAEAEEMLATDLDDAAFERFVGDAFLLAESVNETTST